jgi:hypothetical protein
MESFTERLNCERRQKEPGYGDLVHKAAARLTPSSTDSEVDAVVRLHIAALRKFKRNPKLFRADLMVIAHNFSDSAVQAWEASRLLTTE